MALLVDAGLWGPCPLVFVVGQHPSVGQGLGLINAYILAEMFQDYAYLRRPPAIENILLLVLIRPLGLLGATAPQPASFATDICVVSIHRMTISSLEEMGRRRRDFRSGCIHFPLFPMMLPDAHLHLGFSGSMAGTL